MPLAEKIGIDIQKNENVAYKIKIFFYCKLIFTCNPALVFTTGGGVAI